MNELTFLTRMTSPVGIAAKYDTNEILALNEKTTERGLSLTPTDALEIAYNRLHSLYVNTRVEIGLGAVGKLIETFSKSTFASPDGWATLINDLTENFYFIKTEVHDSISDDRLIAFMFDEFENFCGGSAEILSERCDWLIRRINGDNSEDFREDSYNE